MNDRDPKGKFAQGHKIRAGIILSQDTRDKISESVSQLWGDIGYSTHMSEVHKGQYQPKGENSASWKGGLPSCKICGKNLVNYDAVYCKRHSHSGSRSHFWRDGACEQNKTERQKIMLTAQYKDWRKSVFVRDCYICQQCGATTGMLHAHHIKSFKERPDLIFNIDNGITLCIECHRKTDSWGRRSK